MNSAPPSPLLLKSQQVARAVASHGGRALLVGGFVRDTLLGQIPKDADLEIYGLEAPKLRATLETQGRVDCVGESFRVYKLVWHARGQRLELDVSLPRRDRKVGQGHRGFEVEGDPFASVEDAARRRDFTINAILCDPLTSEILDPFQGRLDLENRLLRFVDEDHFGEDSLRVLRAMQFAARFELTIEPATAALCRQTPLSDLPRERIWGEWEKWLLKSSRPSLGLRAGRDIDAFARLFPPLDEAISRRSLEMERALDGAAAQLGDLEYPQQVALMLATLGSFLGMRTSESLLEILGLFKLRGEKQSVDVRRLVSQLVSARKVAPEWFARRDRVSDKDFRFFSARIPPELALKLARARGFDEAANWFELNLRRLNVFDGPPEALLKGRHLLELGVKPGPIVGQIVERVYLRQLAGEISTVDEAFAAARALIAAH